MVDILQNAHMNDMNVMAVTDAQQGLTNTTGGMSCADGTDAQPPMRLQTSQECTIQR